ncbi:hypothetical protein V500_03829 [Pseudogymnoascus sp. VKM F-4518 (FW-2643)]|nr:hypothetical protein V500_03829 [Pseudogymnoascus sp. VKM F-4518 (FW-2643)]
MPISTTDNLSPYQLPHLQIKLEDIAILNKIGAGDAGIVFEATIASLNDGEKVALKVFKPYLWRYHYTFSVITGRPLSPFDRELTALSVIHNDEEANLDLPVIESYGWFELPANFHYGRFKLSGELKAKVIVKKLVLSPPFDFGKVTPQDMIRHLDMLDRLKIYDTDIRAENFLAGKLADLSASYVLTEITRSDIYNIQDQRPRLKQAVLRYLGLISSVKIEPPKVAEDAWNQLQNQWEETASTANEEK